MDRITAEQMKSKTIAAIEQLNAALSIAMDHTSGDEFEQLKKGIGLAIGAIEMHVNVPLHHQFPDMEN